MQGRTLYGQRIGGRAVIRNHYIQSFPIQWFTNSGRTVARWIYQKGLSLLVALEVFVVIGVLPLASHSTNELLNRSASGNRNRTSGALNNVGSNGNWWTFAPNSQTNARNLNFNSGNVNPLNNNNRANGFGVWPCRASDGCSVLHFTNMKYSFDDIHRLVTFAYIKARQEERETFQQLEFELDLENNLRLLSLELYKGTWYPSPLDWFVNTEPTVREVFAPQFRDRIVSHVLFMLIAPIFERYFVFDSFSCRVGKGTLAAIQRAEHHLRSITNNYTREAHILNYDISGYFMSINRGLLYDITITTINKHQKKFPGEVDYDFVNYLVFTFLERDPLRDCCYYGDPGRIKLVLPNKSLRYQPSGVGIPIGDVINQLFSNIYLNPFDQFIHRELHIKNAIRYVDDGKMFHESSDFLFECKERSDVFLNDRLGLHLHPTKTIVTSTNEPLFFLGAAIKPYRRCVSNATLDRHIDYFVQLDLAIGDGKPINYEHALSVINSRLGYLSHFNEYRANYKLIMGLQNMRMHFAFTKDLSKAILINN